MSHLSKYKILILGASGLLGHTLSDFFDDRGYVVFRHGNTGGMDLKADLTKAEDAERILKKTCPDTIINLIAMPNVDDCETCMNDAYRINVRTLENIIGAVDGKPPYFIHISTDQVYDADGLSAENEICLTNVYALTKYAAELVAAQVPGTILRTNFFGPSRLPGRKSFSDWVIASLEKKEPITAFTDIIFNPVSMDTLSRAVLTVLKKRICGTFNVGSKGPMTKAEFIFETANVMGLDTSRVRMGISKDLNFCAYRPKGMAMNCSKFETAFGMPLPSLKQEIQHLKKSCP